MVVAQPVVERDIEPSFAITQGPFTTGSFVIPAMAPRTPRSPDCPLTKLKTLIRVLGDRSIRNSVERNLFLGGQFC